MCLIGALCSRSDFPNGRHPTSVPQSSKSLWLIWKTSLSCEPPMGSVLMVVGCMFRGCSSTGLVCDVVFRSQGPKQWWLCIDRPYLLIIICLVHIRQAWRHSVCFAAHTCILRCLSIDQSHYRIDTQVKGNDAPVRHLLICEVLCSPENAKSSSVRRVD